MAACGNGPKSEKTDGGKSSDDPGQGNRQGEPRPVTLGEFQQLIRVMYLEKDIARGIDGTFMWLTEEIGELAAALRSGTAEDQAEEFADVIAWLTTIANVAGVDLTAAVRRKYGDGCPGCDQFVCQCDDAEKP
ncbi:MAG: nucleotide pyrophosphohydrolase [Pirellulales bacterium]|nr:nucleotide pyrophosphohydrolase [Pirellulales bacterium]